MMLGIKYRILAVIIACLSSSQVIADTSSDYDTAIKLAELLRSGRDVISSHQALINDPDTADKGLDGEALVRQVRAVFELRAGETFDLKGASPRDRALLDAMTEAMRRTVDAHQDDINRPGVGFKGFIPAVFARLTNEEFAAIAGEDARVRVTAPPELIRNRKSRPDPWELEVIETQLRDPARPAGEAYTARVDVDGRPAFRMMLPEYYRESCLQCHGGPAGSTDITGYPKEGAAVGDLAGIISITIFR